MTERSDRRPTHNTRLSKGLSRVLRHQAVKLGLRIDNGGWIKLNDLLELKMFKNVTLTDIQKVVFDNDKQRFSLKKEGDIYFIRANQGHSINLISSEELLTQVTDPNEITLCVHGTTLSAWKEIVASKGLSRMKRNHVHFAPGLPKWINDAQKSTIFEYLGKDSSTNIEVVSGMRKSANILIFMNVEKLLDLKLYRSSNEVLLCPGDENGIIPLSYILFAYDLENDRTVS